MGLRAEFALHHSGFEAFLFAPLWQEASGSPLSVLSALARLGLDPWKEAAALAQQPRKDAAASLAAILARLPRTSPATPSCSQVAELAVELLPSAVADRPADANEKQGLGLLATHANLLIALLGIAVILLTQVWPD